MSTRESKSTTVASYDLPFRPPDTARWSICGDTHCATIASAVGSAIRLRLRDDRAGRRGERVMRRSLRGSEGKSYEATRCALRLQRRTSRPVRSPAERQAAGLRRRAASRRHRAGRARYPENGRSTPTGPDPLRGTPPRPDHLRRPDRHPRAFSIWARPPGQLRRPLLSPKALCTVVFRRSVETTAPATCSPPSRSPPMPPPPQGDPEVSTRSCT